MSDLIVVGLFDLDVFEGEIKVRGIRVFRVRRFSSVVRVI